MAGRDATASCRVIALQIQALDAKMGRHGEGFETSPAPNQSDRARIIMAAPQIRPIRVKGNIAYVPLTQGYEAIIDAADVALVEGQNWRAHKNYRTVYATTDIQKPDGRWTTTRMHTVLTSFSICDHVDGNGLNNRRCNLREVTAAQNQHNQRLKDHSTSGFKGVTALKRPGRWESRIRVNGRVHYLGCFASPEEAHAAYCAASSKFHGEYGRVR